jgi:tetratricopeptide (TPR) repeat protein
MPIRPQSHHEPAAQPEQDRHRACESESRNPLASRVFIWGCLLLFSVLCFPAQGHGQETLWQNYRAAGNAAALQGRYEDAENLFRAAIEQAERFGSLDPRLADSLNQLAILYATQQKFAQAEPLFQRSLGVSVAALGPDHPDVAIVLRNMGILKASQRQYAEADALLSRSLFLTNRVLGQDHPLVAVTMRTIAVFQAVQGHYGEAERFIRRSIEISEKTLGSEHPEVAASLDIFAQVLHTVHRDREANQVETRAQEIRTRSAGTNGEGGEGTRRLLEPFPSGARSLF